MIDIVKKEIKVSNSTKIGKKQIRRISTSKSKNISEIIKKGIEKDKPKELKDWKPHSKGLPFSSSTSVVKNLIT